MEGLRHAEVVASIKAQEDEARLLVVDPETDEHFKRLRVTPTEEHVEGGLLPGAGDGVAWGVGQPPTRCPHRSTAITSHQWDQPCPGERVGMDRVDSGACWGPSRDPQTCPCPHLKISLCGCDSETQSCQPLRVLPGSAPPPPHEAAGG